MKLWGGRFAKTTDKLAEDFHSSIRFDQRLYREDIQGSVAHATMLGDTGIISQEEAAQIIAGLQELLAEIEAGQIEFDVAAEDIHMNLEQLLTAKIGAAGKKLHTARSRNDQIALDLRLYLRAEIDGINEQLLELLAVLGRRAAGEQETVMPGYTHLQKAQPISFAHHLLAYAQMFRRDRERLRDCQSRLNQSPLGNAALAGTTFAIDRTQTAALLAFAAPTANSLDGVSDRDFALEFLSACSICMMHLSRLSEEIVLWSSHEFAFITLDDAYSTGSSIMPQKKNPDMAELIRGKTGRVYGDMLALFTVMKGLPLAYNKDMQEDKEAVFDAVDTLKSCLLVMTPMLETLRVNRATMRRGAAGGFINATDMADYLAAKGLPFREAHEVVGKLVLYAEQKQAPLDELALDELQAVSPIFEQDIYQAISLDTCLAARKTYGGPAVEATSIALKELQGFLNEQGRTEEW